MLVNAEATIRKAGGGKQVDHLAALSRGAMPSLTVSVAGNQDATEDQSSLRLLVRNRYKLSIRLKSSRSRELTRAYCATPCSRDDFHAHQGA